MKTKVLNGSTFFIGAILLAATGVIMLIPREVVLSSIFTSEFKAEYIGLAIEVSKQNNYGNEGSHQHAIEKLKHDSLR